MKRSSHDNDQKSNNFLVNGKWTLSKQSRPVFVALETAFSDTLKEVRDVTGMSAKCFELAAVS